MHFTRCLRRRNDSIPHDLLVGRYDAFRPTKRCEQASIHFEKAAILFNLGALQSQIALQTERTTDAGVKEAAKLFQVCFLPGQELLY